MKKGTKVGIWFLALLLIALVVLPLSGILAATEEEIEDSIDAGVAWLASQQQLDGSWQGAVAQTAFAVVKLEDRAFELGYDSPFDPEYDYSGNVIAGLNFIFMQASASPCGDGIVYAAGYHETYSTGIAMMAIAGSRDPDQIVAAGNPVVDGMTFLQVLQENVDYFNCAQNPDGGWRYYWTYEPSDNSNTGYAALGLLYAESFGCTIPASIRTGLDSWIDLIQDDVNGDPDDGGSWYDPGWAWVNLLKTGNLLFEMAFVGDSVETQRVQDAIDYIERHWNDMNSDPGWHGNVQAMYCLMKGLESLNIDTIEVGGNPVDWFDEITDEIVATQVIPDGYWPGDYWGDSLLATEWALLTLEKVTVVPSLDVPVDIKPTSCPNPLNTTAKGVLPVAILGTETFDVTQVDPATVMLAGVSPLRWSLQDVATPFEPYTEKELKCDCTTLGPDGYMDLVFQFSNQAVIAAIGPVSKGDVLVLQLTGNLLPDFSGTTIVGEDVMVVVK